MSKQDSRSKRQRLSGWVQFCLPEQAEVSIKICQSIACFGSSVMQVCNFNVRPLAGKEAYAGKAEFLSEKLSRLSIAFCGLCEVRWSGQGQKASRRVLCTLLWWHQQASWCGTCAISSSLPVPASMFTDQCPYHHSQLLYCTQPPHCHHDVSVHVRPDKLCKPWCQGCLISTASAAA